VPLRSNRNLLALALAVLLAGTVAAEPLPAEWWWYWDRPASQLPPPRPGIGAAVLTLLKDLSTLTLNVCHTPLNPEARIVLTVRPTALQEQALRLLGVDPAGTQ
jgi:hypothetical protein